MRAFEEFHQHLDIQLRQALTPLARWLGRLRVTPNQVTLAGAALNLLTAWLIVQDHLLAAGLAFLLAGSFDMLDGLLARLSDQATAFGAFLDSTLDRLSEGVVFTAIVYELAALGDALSAGVAVLALLGSLLVSYTRARAEALGVTCTTGLMQRPERIVLLGLGLIA
ncbi:MAG: CDP-alcohol phosphatidyltransferase family protein, partial [Gammaproteobacteria bacterium]